MKRLLMIATLPLLLGAVLSEPTMNEGGGALSDLASCTVVVTEVATGSTSNASFPASSPSGGGQHSFDEDAMLAGLQEGDVHSVAICVDLDGNSSVDSNVLTRSFPVLVPAAPTLLP